MVDSFVTESISIYVHTQHYMDWITEWMLSWINEWMNIMLNEWMNVKLNEWMNVCMNQWNVIILSLNKGNKYKNEWILY